MTGEPRYSLTRTARFRDKPLDALTDETCSCTECHPDPRTPRFLMVVEVGYGCCLTCVNTHGQLYIEPSADDLAARDRRLLDAAGIPLGYRHMTFETWKGKVPQNLEHWSGGERWSVLLYGPTGTGKTHLAVAVVQRCLRRGDTGVLFFVVSELIRQLKEELDTGIRLLDNKLREAPLLVLDDAFAERETEWARSTMVDLLHHRHANARGTILTTNLAPAQIGAIDARTMSRLEEGIGIQTTKRDLRARRPGVAA